jgi:hypothetical protein
MEDVFSQEELKKAILALQEKQKQEILTNDEKEKILKKCLEDYAKNYNFKVGDIVYWKDNLKNRRIPDYNEPSIVMEVLTEPVCDSVIDSADSSFKEPLTLKLGSIVQDGSEKRFATFLYDGNRFCKK